MPEPANLFPGLKLWVLGKLGPWKKPGGLWSLSLHDECVLPTHGPDAHFPTTCLSSCLLSCLQSSAPQATTTTPAPIAVSAVPWAPTSHTSARTSAPAAQEIQALTLTALPVWPSARVCGKWREISEPWAQDKGWGHKPAGSRAGGWVGSKEGDLAWLPYVSALCLQTLQLDQHGSPLTSCCFLALSPGVWLQIGSVVGS